MPRPTRSLVRAGLRASSPAASTRRCGPSVRSGGTPYFVARGEGAYVVGRRGHALHRLRPVLRRLAPGPRPPRGRRGRQRAPPAQGTTFGAPTAGEVLLAEEISAPRARLRAGAPRVESGTEAAMSAVRLARGATGRDRIVKFAGGYHGHADALLAAGGSGVATLGLPGSAGVTAGAVAATPSWSPTTPSPTLDDDGRRASSSSRWPPTWASWRRARASCEALRAECDAGRARCSSSTRSSPASASPAAGPRRYFGVTPDLWCFGKVIGGGPAPRRLRRPAGPDGQLAPLGPGLPGGHAVGQPAGDRRRGRRSLELVSPADYAGSQHARERISPRRPAMRPSRRRRPLSSPAGRGSPARALPGPRAVRGAHELRPGPHVLCDQRALPRPSSTRCSSGASPWRPGAYEILFVSLAHSDD